MGFIASSTDGQSFYYVSKDKRYRLWYDFAQGNYAFFEKEYIPNVLVLLKDNISLEENGFLYNDKTYQFLETKGKISILAFGDDFNPESLFTEMVAINVNL